MDVHLTCKRCGGRFIEMAQLAFHKCRPEDKPEVSPKRGKRQRRMKPEAEGLRP